MGKKVRTRRGSRRVFKQRNTNKKELLVIKTNPKTYYDNQNSCKIKRK